MIAWLKAMHIVTLSIWCAGLMTMPLMLSRRGELAGPALFATQKAARFAFVTLISPAAFIAIGTGTALIFARETFTLWFAVKLLLVGLLAKLHVRTGSDVVEVFKDDGRYSGVRMVLGLVFAVGLVVSILVVVLAKPAGELFPLPEWLSRPGALGELFGFPPQPSSVTTMPTP